MLYECTAQFVHSNPTAVRLSYHQRKTYKKVFLTFESGNIPEHPVCILDIMQILTLFLEKNRMEGI